MHWIYLVFIIVMTGMGLWGWLARAKWLEKQSKE